MNPQYKSDAKHQLKANTAAQPQATAATSTVLEMDLRKVLFADPRTVGTAINLFGALGQPVPPHVHCVTAAVKYLHLVRKPEVLAALSGTVTVTVDKAPHAQGGQVADVCDADRFSLMDMPVVVLLDRAFLSKLAQDVKAHGAAAYDRELPGWIAALGLTDADVQNAVGKYLRGSQATMLDDIFRIASALCLWGAFIAEAYRAVIGAEPQIDYSRTLEAAGGNEVCAHGDDSNSQQRDD